MIINARRHTPLLVLARTRQIAQASSLENYIISWAHRPASALSSQVPMYQGESNIRWKGPSFDANLQD